MPPPPSSFGYVAAFVFHKISSMLLMIRSKLFTHNIRAYLLYVSPDENTYSGRDTQSSLESGERVTVNLPHSTYAFWGCRVCVFGDLCMCKNYPLTCDLCGKVFNSKSIRKKKMNPFTEF